MYWNLFLKEKGERKEGQEEESISGPSEQYEGGYILHLTIFMIDLSENSY